MLMPNLSPCPGFKLSEILITSFATNSFWCLFPVEMINQDNKRLKKDFRVHINADVCVPQSEKPSTAVMPEDVPEELRRHQCPELVPAEDNNTPKVNIYYNRFQHS